MKRADKSGRVGCPLFIKAIQTENLIGMQTLSLNTLIVTTINQQRITRCKDRNRLFPAPLQSGWGSKNTLPYCSKSLVMFYLCSLSPCPSKSLPFSLILPVHLLAPPKSKLENMSLLFFVSRAVLVQSLFFTTSSPL